MGGLSQGFWAMLCCRALAGAAGGGIAAGGIGLLSTLYASEVRSRLMGYAASVLSMATVIFPILGGWLGLYGWRWAFCLYGLGIPVALAAWLVVPATVTPTANPVDLSQTQGVGRVLRQRRIAALLVALGVASALFYVVVVYAPLYLKAAIGASSMFNGIVLACRAIGAAIISAIGAHRLAHRIGRGAAIATGFLLMALSLGSIPHLQQPPLILLAALGFGLGFGLVMPNFYNALADRSPRHQRAGILAIGTGAASLGQFVSPVLFGPLWKVGGVSVFYVAAGIAATISSLYWLIGYWKLHRHGLP
ncbi:MFS transporter [Halomicronema hongdechloris]|uniref:MFS transporter n=1 Tax=Halomicronema hongdechloris TaxID=1209493 RepID=UPI001CEC27B3|nr:MFS transporter [Halomicronema hongdechloris]